jgi:mannosyl-3-phosphoglycerate phosphatase family protein
MKQIVVFTDLDGTLLDAMTYSFEKSQEALAFIREHHIPLILCSSKTRAEIEHYRHLLMNNDPFISENGGGIFLPVGYRKVLNHRKGLTLVELDKYIMIRLGAPYAELRAGVQTLRANGFGIKGFGDMTVNEISQVTGLPLQEAAMAKERDFDEPFLFDETKENLDSLLASIRELGFSTTRGKYFHLLGNSNKGKAVSILVAIFRQLFGDIYTIALGDSPNDLPMIIVVDTPIIVRKRDGTHDPSMRVPNLVRADGVGPEGWNKNLLGLLKRQVR